MRAILGAASCIGLAIVLAACDVAPGNNDPIRLAITPVATPTSTPQALPTSEPVTYVVQPGDTLSGIAELFGVSVDDIVRANNIADPNSLQVGQELVIPGRPVTPTPGGEGGTPAPAGTPTPQGTQTPGATPTPVLPPPDVTPPLGPTEVPPN